IASAAAWNGKQGAISSIIGNDNASSTNSTTTGAVTVPVPVTTTAGSSNSAQLAAGTYSLRTAFQRILDNVANLFSRLGTAETNIGAKAAKAGDTMTGRIQGASLRGSWISCHTTNTAFYVPQNTDTSSTAQGVWSWRTALGDGYAIVNLSTVNTSSLRYATKANIEAGVNTTSDVFVLDNGVLKVPSKTSAAANNGTLIATEAQVYAVKTTAEAAMPKAGGTFTGTIAVPSKTSAAANSGTAVATEAQVYLKANEFDAMDGGSW
ncbi:MAG: hypothetical protein FWF52_01085, partial [Candidatus Azobacteroides sp.]|nr:hypothetical protein [Candidatus Azobacteroides sp.]